MNFIRELRQADDWLSQESISESHTENTSLSGINLTYLRIVLIRARTGMNDFLVRSSTPKSDTMTNKIVNVRASKSQANTEGYTNIAQALVDRFKKGDTTHDWSTVDTQRLGDMISAEIKFFAQNVNTEMIKFVTEAL